MADIMDYLCNMLYEKCNISLKKSSVNDKMLKRNTSITNIVKVIIFLCTKYTYNICNHLFDENKEICCISDGFIMIIAVILGEYL